VAEGTAFALDGNFQRFCDFVISRFCELSIAESPKPSSTIAKS
jgi:hypothetical protein